MSENKKGELPFYFIGKDGTIDIPEGEISVLMIQDGEGNLKPADPPIVKHIKGRFHNLELEKKGESYYDYVKKELEFKYVSFFKREVCKLSREELLSVNKEKEAKYPVTKQIVEMIENEHKVKTLGVFINHYRDGTDYAPYHKDSYGGDGVFTVSLGGSREFLTKDDSTKEVTYFTLDDGDVFYFNNTFNLFNKHSIPIRKKMNKSRISITIFV